MARLSVDDDRRLYLGPSRGAELLEVVDEMLRRRGGRPPIGSAAASVSLSGWIRSCVRLCPAGHGVIARRLRL